MNLDGFDGLSMKPRILIPLTVQFSVRYIVRTGFLDLICEYAQPVIVLGWEDEELEKELANQGVEVFILPRKRIGVHYSRLLHQLAQWHLNRINTPTTAIDRRRYQKMALFTFLKARRDLRDILYRLITKIPFYVQYLIAKQKKLIWADSNLSEYVNLLKEVNPDAVFCLTPYFIEEELLLRAAEYHNIPLCTAILSFDNLTTRALIPVKFDAYFLWNKYNQAELFRIYPEAIQKTVVIVGAPQFDFYYDTTYIWSEIAWRTKLKLPPDRPIILFGSASTTIAPQEEQWLYHIDEAIENGEIENYPVVLLRRHPNEPADRWDALMRISHHVFFDEPWLEGKEVMGKTNITRGDIEKLTSTLYHSAVHVNASSTMTVDGAIFDRPQIGPAYDETKKAERESYEIYLREHYLPITQSGGLSIVRSRVELIKAINAGLKNPKHLTDDRRKLVREICTYTDGCSTERVNSALKDFIKKIEPSIME